MDIIRFTMGLVIVLVGISIVISPELAKIIIGLELRAFIAAVFVILGAITIFDAVYTPHIQKNKHNQEKRH